MPPVQDVGAPTDQKIGFGGQGERYEFIIIRIFGNPGADR